MRDSTLKSLNLIESKLSKVKPEDLTGFFPVVAFFGLGPNPP